MKRFTFLKKCAVFAAAIALAAGLAGCNAITIDGEDTSEGSAKGGNAIGFSVSTLNNPFFV